MIIIHNARICTLDKDEPIVSAIAIDHGRVIAIGEDNQILSEFPPHANSVHINYDQNIIMPSFTDAHIHWQQYALSLQMIDCETPTRAECLENIALRAQETPPGVWILGHGWNQNDWPEGMGNTNILDEVAPLHPAYLTAKSLHAGWINSKALEIIGIDANTPDPKGGKIEHDEHGNPTGILFETAMQLAAKVIPQPTPDEIAHAISSTQPVLWSQGITGLHDFDRQNCFKALQILQSQGNLGIRVIKNIPLEDLSHAISIGLRSGFGNDFLRIGSIKAYVDGALGPHTAAMLQPYEDGDSNLGMLFMDGEELFEHCRIASQNGFSMSVHAIGDKANHEVLNAYQQLRLFEKSNNLPHLRHRIEHLQLTHPDDTPRVAELGVIASMQPIHATSDMLMADQLWGSRVQNAYAWQSQLKHGAPLAFGSDAPVESPNPFWGLHAAVTRQRIDGAPGKKGWIPTQKISLPDAIRAYTTGAAFAAGMEDTIGKLVPGYFADLIVLDTDLFNCDHDEILEILPVATMVDGEWVHGPHKI